MNHTPQQDAVASAIAQGEDVVVQAGAGTGKSTTLAYAARATVGRRPGTTGLVLAYNANAATSLQGKFPPGFTAMTIHALANRIIRNSACDDQLRIDGAKLIGRLSQNSAIKPYELPKHLGIFGGTPAVTTGGADVAVTPAGVAAMAKATIRRFCNSATLQLVEHHVVVPHGVDRNRSGELVCKILAAARRIWADQIRADGVLPFTHDTYLKLFQIWATDTGYVPPVDLVMLDEAQDSNRLTSSLFLGWGDKRQLVAVGDGAQSMYQWRGAVDSMRELAARPGTRTLTLSRSFRFGPAIADEANEWLMAIDNPFLIQGSPNLADSTVGTVDRTQPHTVLCRTNAGVIGEAMTCSLAGTTIHIVGGGREATSLASGFRDLMNGKRPTHPLLAAFPDYPTLVEYVGSPLCDEADLKIMANLVDRYSPGAIMATLLHCEKRREDAAVVLSTAHKFKGDESDVVAVGGDYKEPQPDRNGDTVLRDEDGMAAYVAVTRARWLLDPGSLSYIRRWNDDHGIREAWMETHSPVV